MSVDTTLWFLAIGLEVVVLALLLQRRISRLLPVFTLYIAWTIFSDVAMWIVGLKLIAQYSLIYSIEMPIDSILQFGVLVELAWSVLRPVRSLLPRTALIGVGGIILLIGAVIWPFAGISDLSSRTPQLHHLIRLQQTFSILRIVFFLVLAAFSQLLAIGWRNRELQVATGLGFYSLISLGGSLVQVHQVSFFQYQLTDQFIRASYFFCLLYWVVSFVRKEAPRGEFNPRIQSLLLAVAGTARANRIALEDIRKNNGR